MERAPGGSGVASARSPQVALSCALAHLSPAALFGARTGAGCFLSAAVVELLWSADSIFTLFPECFFHGTFVNTFPCCLSPSPGRDNYARLLGVPFLPGLVFAMAATASDSVFSPACRPHWQHCLRAIVAASWGSSCFHLYNYFVFFNCVTWNHNFPLK